MFHVILTVSSFVCNIVHRFSINFIIQTLIFYISYVFPQIVNTTIKFKDLNPFTGDISFENYRFLPTFPLDLGV